MDNPTHPPLHVIPIGGQEPEHVHGESCWCKPMAIESDRIMVHHAKDGREKFERQGLVHWDSKWVVVEDERADWDDREKENWGLTLDWKPVE